ncbi:MAG: ankyrin repeat domain-containing protein, partial [bacterium]
TLSVDYPPMRNAARAAADVRAVYQDKLLYAPVKYLAEQLGVKYQEDLAAKEVSVTRDTGVKLVFSTLPNQPVREITPLHDAAAKGDTVAISALLQANPTAIDGRMLSGATPLHMAAFEGQEEAINLLIASKARMNLHDRNGMTPLAAATFQDKPLAVKALLDKGADINAVDSYGQTALFMSILYKKKEIFSLLMAKKADFNIVETATGFTPLHIAVQNGSTDAVQQLIDAGANVNALDTLGITAGSGCRGG